MTQNHTDKSPTKVVRHTKFVNELGFVWGIFTGGSIILFCCLRFFIFTTWNIIKQKIKGQT